MFAFWSLESQIFEIWNKIYTLDVTKFQFNILFVDIINVQVFVKKTIFFLNVQIKCNLTPVFDLVFFQWVYHVYSAM